MNLHLEITKYILGLQMDTYTKSLSSGMELSVIATPPQDVKDLLKSTIYGMKGRMQYRHKNAESKINKLHHPYFVTLRRQNYLLGVVGFMFRNTI